MPIGADKEECSQHGKRVIVSMKDHIIKLGKSNLNMAQKMEGVKFMELPRIDYRMMCADLKASDLESSDRWLRGQVNGWFQEYHGETVDSRFRHFKSVRTPWSFGPFVTS
jgi:hypothetical protein